jgi:hypothetical protein
MRRKRVTKLQGVSVTRCKVRFQCTGVTAAEGVVMWKAEGRPVFSTMLRAGLGLALKQQGVGIGHHVPLIRQVP